jgi:ribosomal-protein-alanine N-acetyltransferase
MNVKPVTLVGRTVKVEPLGHEHAEGLWRLADPEIFTYMGRWPHDGTLEAFHEYVDRMLALPDTIMFAMVLLETGQPVGVTSYMDIRPAHRGLEIGNTWITAPYQGTQVNPENKYLLLRHAFETLGAVRVQLKTDGRNLRSQRAIAKLGAKLEGVLRKHMFLQDGYLRDTVMFSITDDEWPGVKAGLEERLGYVL